MLQGVREGIRGAGVGEQAPGVGLLSEELETGSNNIEGCQEIELGEDPKKKTVRIRFREGKRSCLKRTMGTSEPNHVMAPVPSRVGE